MNICNDDIPLNSLAIKNALKGIGFYFDKYDTKRKKRRETDKIKTKIVNESGGGKKCVLCGNTNLKIEAAHIEPLEAGGATNENNIILLCSNSITSDTPGCHQLFDDGLTSIKRIEKFKSRGAPCECGLIRNQMMELWEKGNRDNKAQNSLQRRISKKQWGEALKLLKRQEKNAQRDELFDIKIKQAEINRKRTAKNGLKQARKSLDSINQSIPKKLRSRFYYELGYVYLLSGEHEFALKQFELSDKYATNNIDRTAAFWLWLNAEIALRGNQSRWEIVENKFIEFDRNKNVTDNINYNRIHVNGLFNQVRVFLIKENFQSAKEKLNEAIDHWKGMDITTGWEKSYIPSILSLKGQVLVSLKETEDYAKKALELFSRYLVIMLAGRQVPEGIRDVLFSVAKCLRINDCKKVADNVIKVANQVLDGASYIYPYKKP